MVVGGGNTSVEEAIYLSDICSHGVLIHRRDKLRAEKMLQDKLFEKQSSGKVTILWSHTLKEIIGDNAGVTGVRVNDIKMAVDKDIPVSGVFIAVGHKPNTEFFAGQLDMRNGYIKVNGGFEGNVTQTSVAGVYAAGDVTDSVYRQAVTSAGSGCMAALDAERYLDI